MTFNETIRIANQFGLLKGNLEQWTIYRQSRNNTSHTYDEKIANNIVNIVPQFKIEVEFLLNTLKTKLE